MNTSTELYPLTLPWLASVHVRLPGAFNVTNLHPLQVTGVLLKPSAAQLRAAFRVAVEAKRELIAKDDAFEDLVYTMRPGDMLLAFTRTGTGLTEEGIALFRLPNQILRQIVL